MGGGIAMSDLLKPYCCQNAVIRLMEHMIPVPESFPVNPICLAASGMEERDFIAGLDQLTAVVRAVYEDMAEEPKAYGLPLVEDIPYPKFNPKARDSMNASKRFALMLMHLANAGTLCGEALEVEIEDFDARNKALKSKDKLANVPMLLSKMRDFGFAFEGFDGKRFAPGAARFTVLYPDSPDVLRALKGYMAVAHNGYDLFPLLYSLAIDPARRSEDQCAKDFAGFLRGGNRAFFEALHPLLAELGLFFRPSHGYAYVLVYLDPKKKEQRTDDGYYVRIFSAQDSHESRRDVALRLRAIAAYADRIEAMPERIQAFFAKTSCRRCMEECSMRICWSLGGQTYEGCSYWNHTLTGLRAEDAPFIAELVKLEMAQGKRAKAG